MTTQNEINQAIEEVRRNAFKYEDEMHKAFKLDMTFGDREDYLIQLKKDLPTEKTVGDVTVKGSFASNMVAPHVKITYKLNGKRASKAKIQDYLAGK